MIMSVEISNAGTQGGTTVGPAMRRTVAFGCRTHAASVFVPQAELRYKTRLSSGTTARTNTYEFLFFDRSWAQATKYLAVTCKL